jgi:hypothetical protein
MFKNKVAKFSLRTLSIVSAGIVLASSFATANNLPVKAYIDTANLISGSSNQSFSIKNPHSVAELTYFYKTELAPDGVNGYLNFNLNSVQAWGQNFEVISITDEYNWDTSKCSNTDEKLNLSTRCIASIGSSKADIYSKDDTKTASTLAKMAVFSANNKTLNIRFAPQLGVDTMIARCKVNTPIGGLGASYGLPDVASDCLSDPATNNLPGDKGGKITIKIALKDDGAGIDTTEYGASDATKITGSASIKAVGAGTGYPTTFSLFDNNVTPTSSGNLASGKNNLTLDKSAISGITAAIRSTDGTGYITKVTDAYSIVVDGIKATDGNLFNKDSSAGPSSKCSIGSVNSTANIKNGKCIVAFPADTARTAIVAGSLIIDDGGAKDHAFTNETTPQTIYLPNQTTTLGAADSTFGASSILVPGMSKRSVTLSVNYPAWSNQPTTVITEPVIGNSTDCTTTKNVIIGQIYTCNFPLTTLTDGHVYILPPAGILARTQQGSSSKYGDNSPACTLNTLATILTCSSIPTTGGTNNLAIGAAKVGLKVNGAANFIEKGDLNLVALAFDPTKITDWSCVSAFVNSTTTCSFTLPTNTTLPADFKISIGDATEATCSNVSGSAVTCNLVPTGSIAGNISIFANTGGQKINTNKTVTINAAAITPRTGGVLTAGIIGAVAGISLFFGIYFQSKKNKLKVN